MAIDIHTISIPTGANGFQRQDLIRMGLALSAANVAGSGAGAAVTVVVSIASGRLPPNYMISVNPGQDATWWVTAKSSTGFTINLAPRLAASTLAAGTVDWFLVG